MKITVEATGWLKKFTQGRSSNDGDILRLHSPIVAG